MSSKFTRTELAALLKATAEQMLDFELDFSATFDGNSDADKADLIADTFDMYGVYDENKKARIKDSINALLAIGPEEFVQLLLKPE